MTGFGWRPGDRLPGLRRPLYSPKLISVKDDVQDQCAEYTWWPQPPSDTELVDWLRYGNLPAAPPLARAQAS